MKLQTGLFSLILIFGINAAGYGAAFDADFGARASTGSSGSSIGADTSISYSRQTSATSVRLSGSLDVSANSESGSTIQWGADNAYTWQSPARIITQRFNLSHAEKEAIYSDKVESVDAVASQTTFQLSRNRLLSHVAGLNLNYSHGYESTDGSDDLSSEVSSWTLFDALNWIVTSQSRLSSTVSYKKIDAEVTNTTIGLGWSYLKNNQTYDFSVNDTFIAASGYNSEQLGYGLKMNYQGQAMNVAAEMKKQVVDSIELLQIAGSEDAIEENVISSVTSASLVFSDIDMYGLATVSVFITGGVSEQMLAYNQFDFELGSDSEFASAGVNLAAPIMWGTAMNLSANRGYQAEQWTSLYSIGLVKALNAHVKLAANSKMQNDNLSWSASISYQH